MIWGVIEITGVAGSRRGGGGVNVKRWRGKSTFRNEEAQKSVVTRRKRILV